MKHNHYTMIARNAIKKSLKNLPKDSAVGFGCSGGADSTALLLALSTIYRNERAKLVHVVIVDHQLQEVTREVSKNVAQTAESYGFTTHIIPVEISKTSEGSESDARKARYEAFERIINEYDLKAFFTGHTKSDQAEQVMLGILRGSGSRSLSGIRSERGVYKRPFLNTLSREETQKVCEENSYEYWCDPHNDLTIYRRVAVRKFLKNFENETGQKITESLVKTAAINSEEADALDFYAEMTYPKAIENNWSVDFLKSVPSAVRKRLYRKILLDNGVKSEKVSFLALSSIDELISDWRGQGEVRVSKNLNVSRVSNSIIFE